MNYTNFTYDLATIQDDFYNSLPHKPYCTDDLGYLIVRPKSTAIQKRYIQHNPPCQTVYLVFDVDRAFGAVAWYDEHLPPPTWTTQNPTNGHAHTVYALKTPVCTTEYGSKKALNYLAKVQAGIARKLGADTGYSGLITKNPLHRGWRTTIWNTEPYELGDLAEFVDLLPLTEKEQQIGLGRNCTLFDTVRKWAYRAVREHRGGKWGDWYTEVLKHALNANTAFLEPLPYSEVRATAKSIAKYCWQNDTTIYNQFRDRQSVRGSKGNSSKGGKTRSAKYDTKRQKALYLCKQGVSNAEIARTLGVSRRTVINWLK